ncbi:hypothetical protein T440DRAFT_188337 [Plenodomus tracheiphilus IPT5]|uniref:Uncharacterized protein n=1 Tax=Plenodomus tracheiphilus IPT5 TaxID=1408161 RepID=A0A6A7B0B1_9PLEO|nr:hypothetical protein T440DRAFT_188337 [Plenodomus tracheiphilus IPT5]
MPENHNTINAHKTNPTRAQSKTRRKTSMHKPSYTLPSHPHPHPTATVRTLFGHIHTNSNPANPSSYSRITCELCTLSTPSTSHIRIKEARVVVESGTWLYVW